MVIAGGVADTMPKVFEHVGNPAHEEAFILTTFATAFVVCLVMLLRSRERPAIVDIACGAMLGTFNFFSTDLMLRALLELPAYVVYTGFSMGVVLITYAINVLVMHEKLTRRDHVALVLVILALALINIQT
jgi:multidrug transporter EmrE-like cation transporter